MGGIISIVILLCVITFSAISSRILRADYAHRNLARPSIKYRNSHQQFKVPTFMGLKKFIPHISINNNLDLLVHRIIQRYLAKRKRYYRTSVANMTAVEECEDECTKEVRIVCSYGSYTCTDFTIHHLSHSCYLQCHWQLPDSNPYREHLYQEKFRKGAKRTTTTDLPHPSTRRTTVEDLSIEV